MSLDIPGLQTLSSVVSLALWIAKAENAPKEVARCLELVQLIYKDTQYLIELRNESLPHLERTPRELQRINDVIATATRSIADLGAVLERYRPEAHGGRTGLRSRVLWVLADSETFSLRAPNLVVQHSTVLSEVQMLRNARILRPLLEAAGRAERTGLAAPSRGTHLSPPPYAVPRRPLTPTYDIASHARLRPSSHSLGPRLRPQPSLASLFDTPLPPYSQTATAASEPMGAPSPSESNSEHTGSVDYPHTPLILSETVPQEDEAARTAAAPHYQRSSMASEPFVGLRALLSEGSATLSSTPSVDPTACYGSMGTPAPRPSQDGYPALTITYSTASATEVKLHHSTDTSAAPSPGPPLHLRLSELFAHKAVPAVTVQPLIHELDTAPLERQTLFEAEAPVPAGHVSAAEPGLHANWA